MKTSAGLFLDRDGTLVEDLGYMGRPEQMRLLPGVAEALRRAVRHYRLYLVTNQSGVGRGYYTLADAQACNQRVFDLLGADLAFQGVCIATETSEEIPRYRKPSPRYLLETIARDHLDPARCWMVGDRLSDLQCGVNAGIRAALVRQTEHAHAPDIEAYVRAHRLPAFESLADCVDALVVSCGA